MLAAMTVKKDADMSSLRLIMMMVVAVCGFGLAALAADPSPADAAMVHAE